MLRRDSSRIDPPERDEPSKLPEPPQNGTGGIDIQRELNRIEEILFDSLHIPWTRRTLVDEDMLLAQLDLVRENLPNAFDEAQKIIRQREEIFIQAEDYAQELIESAERRVDQMLDELGIIQQAELEAAQIRQRVQQECDAIQEQTRSEIDRMRLQAHQELEQMRQIVIADCEDIQNGADDYADRVLTSIEQQLIDMLRVIRNGRQQLQDEGGPDYPNTEPGSSTARSSQPPSKF